VTRIIALHATIHKNIPQHQNKLPAPAAQKILLGLLGDNTTEDKAIWSVIKVKNY